jgi:glycosyltransferase involved in cell wall biosynthesis
MAARTAPTMAKSSPSSRPAAAAALRTGRPRILWLHTQPEPYFGRLIDDLAEGTGYRVPSQGAPPHPSIDFQYIAAFCHRGPDRYAGGAVPASVETVFLRPRRGREKRCPSFVERYHRDWRADLLPLKFDLAIVSGYATTTARELLAHCARQGIPAILWSDSNIRTHHGRGPMARLRRRLKRAFLAPIVDASAALLTANSRGIAYWRYFGAPRGRIHVAPYYADYRCIEQARATPREEVLARAGLPPGRFLYTAARLAPEKGLDASIRAFAASWLANRGYTYVIAGAGPLEGRLRALAGASAGRSIIFAGFRQPADNLALMAHADLFVLPSRAEPHGIVVAEAMAAGTPVIARRTVGAGVDLIVHQRSGMIFREDEELPALLAQAVVPETLAALRAAARPAFEAWYARCSPIDIIPAIARRLLAGTPDEVP